MNRGELFELVTDWMNVSWNLFGKFVLDKHFKRAENLPHNDSVCSVELSGGKHRHFVNLYCSNGGILLFEKHDKNGQETLKLYSFDNWKGQNEVVRETYKKASADYHMALFYLFFGKNWTDLLEKQKLYESYEAELYETRLIIQEKE